MNDGRDEHTDEPFSLLARVWRDLLAKLEACGRAQPARAGGAARWMSGRLLAWKPDQADASLDWRSIRSAFGDPDPRVAAAARRGAQRCRDILAAARVDDADDDPAAPDHEEGSP